MAQVPAKKRMARLQSTQVFWQRLLRIAEFRLMATAVFDLLARYAAHTRDVFRARHRRSRRKGKGQ